VIDISTLQNGWFIAMGARTFLSGRIDEIAHVDWQNLLELRAFTPEHEIKLIRGGLGEPFQRRDSLDLDIQAYEKRIEKRKETYYLDIDMVKTKKYRETECIEERIEPNEVFAIGGGKYRLPEPTPETMEVEIYYRADVKGFYQPFDFRVVSVWKKGA